MSSNKIKLPVLYYCKLVRLDSAIEKGDLVEVRVAKGLLEGYQQIKNMEIKDAAETKKISLNKRKSALINSFIKKRKKEFLFIFC
jgi:hypothetical protein